MPSNTVRVYFQGEKASRQLTRSTTKSGERVRKALLATAHDARDKLATRIEADISNAGGSLNKRYANTTQVDVSRGGGNIRISVENETPGFSLLNTGGVIEGNPIMWIPLTGGPKGVYARDYSGTLVMVKRSGGAVPLLVDPVLKKPMYSGETEINVRKKLHTTEIVEDVSKELPELYKTNLPLVE